MEEIGVGRASVPHHDIPNDYATSSQLSGATDEIRSTPSRESAVLAQGSSRRIAERWARTGPAAVGFEIRPFGLASGFASAAPSGGFGFAPVVSSFTVDWAGFGPKGEKIWLI